MFPDQRVEHTKYGVTIRRTLVISPAQAQKIPRNRAARDAHDPYLALRSRDFRLLLIGRFIATLGEQMVNIAIGWELYERTHSALSLGLVGLVQIIPIFALSLPAGHVADQRNRKHIILCMLGLLTTCALGLALLSATHGALPLIYLCLFGIGITHTFYDPAISALISGVVPKRSFANAATWSSSVWQLASVAGPALGGLIIGIFRSATLVYVLETVACLLVFVLFFQIRYQRSAAFPVRVTKKKATLATLVEGVDFVLRTKIILAAITLDLFAVLLGGATTLLPIYAKDILHVGPVGLGWLRAMPSIGAVLMAVTLAHLPPMRRAGRTLLLSVGGFGLTTIIFGLSRSFPLSLAMLFLLGSLDNISVVIRATLMLLRTPDAMRGRVSAVNSVFVGASNELGGFESGATAAAFGPILSVVGGGIGTLLVVLLVAYAWPEMRRLTTLSGT